MDFMRVFVEVDYIFETMHNLISKMIYDDISGLYAYVESFELAFSCIGLILNILLILYIVFGVVRYLQKYYDILDYSSNKIRKAISNEFEK